MTIELIIEFLAVLTIGAGLVYVTSYFMLRAEFDKYKDKND